MKMTASLGLLVSALALILGCLSLVYTSIDAYTILFLYALCAVHVLLFLSAKLILKKSPGYGILIFSVLALGSAIILSLIPEYWQGFNINGIFHRSIFSAIILPAIAVPAACFSLYYLLGATPKAYDLSRYPIIVFPIVLVLAAYVFILIRIVIDGAPQLNWSILTTPFKNQSWESMVWQNGWPVWVSNEIKQIGMLNHILGTFLLMGLTSAISLPIGVGVGIFVHQYAGKHLGEIINFSTTVLRSISAIVLLVTALSLARVISSDYPGTIINYIISGFGYYPNGVLLTGRSSFLFASILISLLVIPIIARSTEEGLRSMPKEIWEGSLAVGASKEHTLLHVSLPWSLPNIITGLIIGCAEAAGSLAILFLLAGTGELGVSPLNETTSLAYLIFECRYGKTMGDPIQIHMESYQYTAAFLLLLITVGLTVSALIIKSKIARRYR